MNAIKSKYRGLGLLVDLNWDRGLYLGALAFALAAGAYLGSA
ncbi:hypothetical protein [Sulfitobacter sp. CW3]|nr:hypothetical protein [Sulfitobacter sp. CW3]|tara:strand:- start:113642 stop:113767 length:126 start_codon:yes stop_codon:yes gene_type:complete